MESYTEKELIQLQDCMFRAADFIQTFLPDMIDTTKTVKLTQPQIDAIDSIQFGFPLSKYDFVEVKVTPRGIVMIWPRQTGKSYSCAYAAVAFSIIMKNCHIGIISASEDAARKLMRKVKDILRYSIFYEEVVHKTERMDFVELNNGNSIECWPCTENIRGSTYTFLFCDEAAIIEEKILFDAALPTVTHGIRWIMLSTPMGPKGKFVDYYFKGLKTRPIVCKQCGTSYPQAAFNVDDFPHGHMPLDAMYPCVECGALDYKYGIGEFGVPWVDPWNDGVRDPKLIKRLLDEHNWSPSARQEYLGEIVSGASMVFQQHWIDGCTNIKLKNVRKRDKNIDYVIGADYGKKHDASAFYVTHFNEKRKEFVLDFGMTIAGEYDTEKEYYHIRAALLKLIIYYNPIWVVPDATGLGDPLVGQLEQDIEHLSKGRTLKILDNNGREEEVFCPFRLRTQVYHNKKYDNKDPQNANTTSKGFIISRTTKPSLIGELIKTFANYKIKIPPTSEPEIGELRQELLRYECDIKPGTNYIQYGTQAFHDDRVISLALSVWGHRFKPSIIDKVKIIGGQYDFNEFKEENNSYYESQYFEE